MLDPLTLDQLRVFVAIAEQGSFSAAARHLRRAQSAISNAIANLEGSLGVPLFDRSDWRPQLTVHGRALLKDAEAVLVRTDHMKTRAKGLAGGLEAELSIVFDIFFPVSRLVDLATRFYEEFPEVDLRIHTEVLGGVPEMVLEHGYSLGVQGSFPDITPGLVSHEMLEIALEPVAAPQNPLAQMRSISPDVLREHPQIILTDRSGRTKGRTYSVYSEQRILTGDLGSKHAMLRAGLGWGFMPYSVVEEDLASRRLIALDLAERPARTLRLPLYLVYRSGHALGPAGKWVMRELLRTDSGSA
ncbi:transcriptional regulator, LysR family [Mesorhizobium albiziae]|uniref:Transcriptional regulator, LysR family n=1 Tax=Neomesorhizobium albiziae TaxID=335020 RepID=A0A1I3WUX8_9HYPH|nr:LysR family transcriptional regulator [Mesorhizobium albiziae]GLS31852.1 LysR family transcriptional regulator [Mesorhizobium albiziae]SFK10276.1 transcriptional regulator, LysR family [Mesorhizobium albiziae]